MYSTAIERDPLPARSAARNQLTCEDVSAENHGHDLDRRADRGLHDPRWPAAMR